MKQTEALHALQIALIADVPVLLWGEPGTGKTSAINAMSQALNWPLETVLASLREPSDFAGLPVVVDKEMIFAPPDWARRLAGLAEGICFFDEISTAAPSTQKALLRVIHERVVGDLPLGSGIRMVAAANAADVAAGGWDLSAPLANRFLHLNWELDPRVVVSGLMGHWPDPASLHIEENWEQHIPRQAALVAGFLSARPAAVHQRPKDQHSAGLAWPSPRSWEAVIRILAAADGSGASEETLMGLVAGLVGEGSAVEFLRFQRDLDLPDPEELLAQPNTYRKPQRNDQVHAIIASIVSSVRYNLTGPRWTSAMEVFVKVAQTGQLDVAAVGLRALAPLRPDGAEAPDSLGVFGELLITAGLMAAQKASNSRPSPRPSQRSRTRTTTRRAS
jgi:MoxR-like ATPase